MSARTHNFRIGLFVLIGALLFVGALFAMGLRAYFGQHEIFETWVTGKVENLSVGALVKLRGVTIGKVSSIDFAGKDYPQVKEEFVVVRWEVPRGLDWITDTNVQQMLDSEVGKGLRARVQGQGFLGANIIALEYVDPALYPVEPIPAAPKHYYIPSAPSQLNRVIASIEKSLHRVENIDLPELLARAQKLIDAANHLILNVDHVNFDELGSNATALVVEFRETNRGIQRTLANAQSTLTNAQTTIIDADKALNGVNLPALGSDTRALEAKLSTAAVELKRVLASIDTGELNGSLANIRNATDELIVLLRQIEQRPSSVLFSRPPRPVPALDEPPKK